MNKTIALLFLIFYLSKSYTQCNQDPGINSGDLGCVTFIYKSELLNYTTVRAKDGNIWLQQNLGSENVANSKTDETSYGDLFQWGRWDDGHQNRSSSIASPPVLNNPLGIGNGNTNFFVSSPNWWIGFALTDKWEAKDISNITDTVGCDPCRAISLDWRLPTSAEWETIITSETITSPNDAFNSNLKLPLTGNRDTNGNFNFTGARGYYWSGTTSSSGAKYLYFSSAITNPSAGSVRGQGAAIRCIKASGNLNQVSPNKIQITIYPNPTNNLFKITTEYNGQLEIYDIFGNKILSSRIEIGESTIDLTNYPTGVYFLKFTNNSNEVRTTKIIKQ